MRILRAGASNKGVPRKSQVFRGANKGFTLLELLVVITIISIVIGLVMPSFFNIGRETLKAEARRLAGIIRYTYDTAVAQKRQYSLLIDIDRDRWKISGGDDVEEGRLRDDVKIEDIIVPSRGKIKEGEVAMTFTPLGLNEPLEIHLKEDKGQYSLIFNPYTGRVKVLEGYVE